MVFHFFKVDNLSSAKEYSLQTDQRMVSVSVHPCKHHTGVKYFSDLHPCKHHNGVKHVSECTPIQASRRGVTGILLSLEGFKYVC
jgi:hypothetical protein